MVCREVRRWQGGIVSSYLSGASTVGRRVPLGSLAVPPYNVAIAVDRRGWACVIKCNQGIECSELPAFSSLSAGCCSSFPLTFSRAHRHASQASLHWCTWTRARCLFGISSHGKIGERAKLKGFQFDKTLSANFSSEQLTEINSLFFFHRPLHLTPYRALHPRPSATLFSTLSDPHTPPRVCPSSILWISFERFTFPYDESHGCVQLGARNCWWIAFPLSRDRPPFLRCKFEEFHRSVPISSRLNAFNAKSSRARTIASN